MNGYGIGCPDCFRLVALGYLLIYFVGSKILAVARLLDTPNDNVADRRAGRYIRPYRIDIALFEYIESFYNRKRRHGALDYKTPQQVEDETLAA